MSPPSPCIGCAALLEYYRRQFELPEHERPLLWTERLRIMLNGGGGGPSPTRALRLIWTLVHTWETEGSEIFSSLAALSWGVWTQWADSLALHPDRYLAMLQVANFLHCPPNLFWILLFAGTGVIQFWAVIRTFFLLQDLEQFKLSLELRKWVALWTVFLWGFVFFMVVLGDWTYSSTPFYLLITLSQGWAFYRLYLHTLKK